MLYPRIVSCLVAAVTLGACAGTPSGSVCPTTDPPTYASFGDAFFETNCRGCHSANATSRHGAPGDQNYDSEAEIKRHASDIDVEAAAGPDATNDAMPEIGSVVRTAPTQAERERLGEYLACLKAQ